MTCGWCTPAAERTPGESHGMCDTCKAKLDAQIKERERLLAEGKGPKR